MSENKAVSVAIGELGTVDDFIQYLLDGSLKLGNKLETKIVASKLFTLQHLTKDRKYPGFKVAVYHTTEGVVVLILQLNSAMRNFQPNISLRALHHYEPEAQTARFTAICDSLDNRFVSKQVTADVIHELILEWINS